MVDVSQLSHVLKGLADVMFAIPTETTNCKIRFLANISSHTVLSLLRGGCVIQVEQVIRYTGYTGMNPCNMLGTAEPATITSHTVPASRRRS